jgi:hypothetical protein
MGICFIVSCCFIACLQVPVAGGTPPDFIGTPCVGKGVNEYGRKYY